MRLIILISLNFLIFFLNFGCGFCSYYREGKEGWWWYKEYKKEEKRNEKRVEKKQEEKESSKKENKEEQKERPFSPAKPLTEYTYEELLKMPVSEFKKIFDYYRDLAISDPTNETNVYYFYNLVDIARKKSLLFMSQVMNVMDKYPELNVGKDVPTTFAGRRKMFALQREAVEKALKDLRDKFGLILFVKEGCSYCDIQIEMMKYFIGKGIPVKIVDISYEQGAINKFGIETVPMIILVDKKTGHYLPIGVGVISAMELEDRIARLYGVLRGEKDLLQGSLFDFEKGTSLDPFEPPPLFKKNKDSGGKK